MRLTLFVILWAAVATGAVPPKTDVVVIGAGLSGLAAGRELVRAGVPFHVLEISPRVGGRVRTVRYEREGESISVDSGMEEYWESNPAVAILKELGLAARIDIALSSLVLDGKLQALGDESGEKFQNRILGAEGYKALGRFKASLSAWLEKLKVRPLPPDVIKLKDQSFAAWIEEQKLPRKVSEWVRVSIECEIGTGWERISALDGIAEMHIFAGGGEKAVRVLDGNDRFTEALADAVGRANISVDRRVTSVRTSGKTVRVGYLDQEKNLSGTIEAAWVISTIPLYRLFEVQFEPPLSETKRRAIETMGWGSYFKAHIFLPAAAERFWKKSGTSILPILSDSKLGVIYDGTPEAKGKWRVISLLITGDHAEHFNLTPLDGVRAELGEALEAFWPGIKGQIKGIEFYRYHPRAIAAWPPGRSRFDELSEAVREAEHRVHLAGDFTESSHSDGAFLSASRAVSLILGERARLRAEISDSTDSSSLRAPTGGEATHPAAKVASPPVGARNDE